MARKQQKKAAPRIAELDTVEEFATTIKQAWVNCRTDGHSMGPHNVTMDEEGNYLRTRRCRSCGYKRHYVIDGVGNILDAKSEYPDGYLMPKGTGRIDSEGRTVFRQATLEAEYQRKAAR